MMDKIEIDDLTRDYYKAISFRNEHAPDLSAVNILFYNEGILVNNSFRRPTGFSAASFVTALESEIAAGSMTQYLIHELHARTEIYGKLAQRISVYEYDLGEETSGRLPKGVNYIQFVKNDDNWRILSMAWYDENENNLIPAEYLR
jgi:hypothetical protein